MTTVGVSTAMVNLAVAAPITIGATGLAEVIQNVRVILSTRVGSVPLDRDFGVSWEMIDLPTPQAKAELAAEIFEKIHQYEPRATVTNLEWIEAWPDAMDGRLYPSVTLEIKS